MSTKIIALFNLKSGVDVSVYEEWAKTTDRPTVRALKSIDGFEVLRTNGLLGSDLKPPFEYVEIIEVNDMATFGEEVSSETMQRVAGEFEEFADNPFFILTESVED